MSFKRMFLDLGDELHIEVLEADETAPYIDASLYHQDKVIGAARIITDRIDVEIISRLSLEEAWISHLLPNQKTLGETWIKFLIKYPNLVRKPEFRLITQIPKALELIVARYHFDQQDHLNELMLRTEYASYGPIPSVPNISFHTQIEETDLPRIFDLLCNHADWQAHLTIERLNLLTQSAICVLAKENNIVVGFARVVSDQDEIASLWDVVVASSHQKRGIATHMLHQLLTDQRLLSIKEWVLFSSSESARRVYSKLGFVSAEAVPGRQLVQKLKIQTEPPIYLLPLLQEIRVRATANTLKDGILRLNETQTQRLLFGTKRENLAQFWRQNIAFVDDLTYRHSETTFFVTLLLSMLLVDTYAFRNILYPYFSGQLDNSVTHQAAITIIPNIVNIMVVGLSFLFSMNMTGAVLVGQLSQLTKYSSAWKEKGQEIVDLFRNGLIIASIIAPLCMLTMIYSKPISMQVMGQSEPVAEDASRFLIPYSSVVPAVFTWMPAAQIINAFQYNALTLAGPINFGIAVFLVVGLSLGKFGMPKMGELGIVVGYDVEAYLTAAVHYIPLFFSPVFKDLQFWRLCYSSPQFWSKLKNQLFSSSAITTNLLFEFGLLWNLSRLSAKLGKESQAALALEFESVGINLLFMIAGSVIGAIIVGGHKGAQHHQDVYRTSQGAVFKTFLICAIIPSIFAIDPSALTVLFNGSNTQTKALLKKIIILFTLGQIGDGAAYAQMVQARIFNDNWIPTALRGLSLASGGILANVLVYQYKMGIESLGIGFMVAEWTSCITLGIRLRCLIHAYRLEYNVLTPAAYQAQLSDQACDQASWGFLGRGRTQRYHVLRNHENDVEKNNAESGLYETSSTLGAPSIN